MNHRSGIMSSYYSSRSSSGEGFTAEHAFALQVAGSLKVSDGITTTIFGEGEFRFSVRNSLAKFVKIPSAGGAYRSITVFFDQDTLRNFSREYGITVGKAKGKHPQVFRLKDHTLYKTFISSIEPYFPFSTDKQDALVQLKLKEILLILLKVQPELKDILFDFSEPAKIDLAAFMEQNYKYNLKMPRFAYLTGRSLSAFKRDFEKIYQVAPSRWLLQKRLQEAYYLIREKKQRPLDVFMEVGFEDLSHFSYAFKKEFGVPPSAVGS